MKKYIFGLAAFISFSLSYLIGYEEENANHMLILVKGGLIFVSAVLFFMSCDRNSESRIKKSYSVLNMFILLYEILLLVSAGKTILYIRDYPAILNSIVWIICPAMNIIRFKTEMSEIRQDLFRDREQNILIISSLIIATFVIILSAEPSGVRFTWDSDTLYQLIYGLGFESLYDAKLMTFHSHVSIVYAHILVLLKLLTGNIRTSYFILNALCILAASFGFTFLIRRLVPEKKPAAYILCNAMFMLSPWVCGMSTHHMYDYYIWCLTPLLVFFASKRDWIWFFVTGVLITFSKASGLVVFGSICIGVLVTDIVRSKAVRIIANIRYWFFASVALIFVLFFKNGIASDVQFEDTRFGFDASHVLHQLKLYSTANFMWVFVISTILLVIYVYFAKKLPVSTECDRIVKIMLISDVIFILFNCLCITYRLPRYMDSHIAVTYICTAVLFLSLDSVKVSYALTGIITAATFTGAFRMIDPVSQVLFNTINVGDHRIVDFEKSDHPMLEDSVICNREYYSYEALLNKALTYVINDRADDDEIMFSLGNDSITWGFSGGRYSYDLSAGKHYFEEFYDTEAEGLANGYDYEYFNDPSMIPFAMHYIFPDESVEQATEQGDAKVFYYIYMPTMNGGKEAEIAAKFDITHEESFEFRGWKMNCIRFTI